MAGVKDAQDLFFELSSDERLRILTALQGNPRKLTQISTELELPNQEVSRQLSRLVALDLCLRDSAGLYSLTPYAGDALILMPGYEFLAKHRLYFRTHSTASLPMEFRLRIGELASCAPISDIVTSQFEVQQTLAGASVEIRSIVEVGNLTNVKLVEDALRRGVENRIILPMGLQPSDAYVSYMRSCGVDHPNRSGKANRRYIERIPIGLVMSEREATQILFPNLEGKLDYSGFKSRGKDALKWCTDLFNHLWGISVKTPPRLVELFGWG